MSDKVYMVSNPPTPNKVVEFNPDICNGCNLCVEVCPTDSHIAVPGVPAWEQDLEHTVERAGRRQDKEQMMERLRKLGYM